MYSYSIGERLVLLDRPPRAEEQVLTLLTSEELDRQPSLPGLEEVLHHTPHECRHTFETKLDSAGANRKCIDLLMGHVSKDTGNRVYNHKTLDELKATVELIP